MRSYQLMVDAIANLGKDMRDYYHIDQMCLCQTYRTMTCLSDTPDCRVLDGGEDFFSEANLTMMLENSFVRYARRDI